MPFKKGEISNPSGRKRGIPNRNTAQTRDWIKGLIEENREQLEKDLKSLEPRERWNIVEKLLNYTVPKMQSVDARIDFSKLNEEEINIIIDKITENL